MSAQILDGKTHAKVLMASLQNQFKPQSKPSLAIISTDDDEASQVYVRSKINAANQCGVDAKLYCFNSGYQITELFDFIEQLNNDSYVHGIIIQLPLNLEFAPFKQELLDTISPLKDVDGLSTTSAGKLASGQDCFIPCTPFGIMTLLNENKIFVRGKHVVIIGRSDLVGLPLARLMNQRDATVTLCHSLTQNLDEITRQADILVSATGCPKLVTADMVKPGAVVVDVGIHRMQNGKLCGDVDFDKVKKVAGWITPVPGGVGPMTVASLMYNVYYAQYCMNH